MDETRPLLPLDEMKRHGARVYMPSQAELQARLLKNEHALEGLRARHQRAVNQTRAATIAVVLVGGMLIGLLLALGVVALLGL